MRLLCCFACAAAVLADFSVPAFGQEVLDSRVGRQAVEVVGLNTNQSEGLLVRPGNSPTVVSPTYRLGPGDTLNIWVRDSDEIGGRGYRVGSDGCVRLPLVGRIPAAGSTTEEVEQLLIEKLGEFLFEPDALVTMESFGSRPVSILGEVQNPGNIFLQGPTTLLQAISAVGGLSPSASYNAVVSRDPSQGLIEISNEEPNLVDGRQIVEVDLGDLMTGVSADGNVLLAANDIVTVQKAEVLYVLGSVNRAGGFVMSRERRVTVLQAVAMAEGWLPTASPGNAYILRVTDTAKRRELPVDLTKIMKGTAEDLMLRSDDILFIPGSKTKQLAQSILTATGGVVTSVAVWRLGR